MRSRAGRDGFDLTLGGRHRNRIELNRGPPAGVYGDWSAAIEARFGWRLPFKRRIKTQCALPSAETAAMLFWALMASGQITMRRVDGWQTLDQAPANQALELAA